MGVALDVVIGTEVNRDNVAAHTSAIRRHPTEITTSHQKSGSSDRSFKPGTLHDRFLLRHATFRALDAFVALERSRGAGCGTGAISALASPSFRLLETTVLSSRPYGKADAGLKCL